MIRRQVRPVAVPNPPIYLWGSTRLDVAPVTALRVGAGHSSLARVVTRPEEEYALALELAIGHALWN